MAASARMRRELVLIEMRFSALPHSNLSPEEGGGAQAFLVSHSLTLPPFSLLPLLRPPPSLAGRAHRGCVQGPPPSSSQASGLNDLDDLACLDNRPLRAAKPPQSLDRLCQLMGADWMAARGLRKNMDRDGFEAGHAQSREVAQN